VRASRPGQPPAYALKADFFRVLGHPARVRILQLLRGEERSVGALQELLELDSSAVSQHLASLRRAGLVASRREGTSVYYRVSDSRTLELLELAKAIITSMLEQNQALLDDLAVEEFAPGRKDD
jgi:DNA-binding transcriptional ArsR family regulator